MQIKAKKKFWNVFTVLLATLFAPWDKGTVLHVALQALEVYSVACCHFRCPDVVSDVSPQGSQVWQSIYCIWSTSIQEWKLETKWDAWRHSKWYKVPVLSQVADVFLAGSSFTTENCQRVGNSVASCIMLTQNACMEYFSLVILGKFSLHCPENCDLYTAILS